MAYSDKYGKTDLGLINHSVDALGLSWDVDGADEADKSKRYPCFLMIPKFSKDEHYHIGLTTQAAIDLRDWLDAFLKDVQRI